MGLRCLEKAVERDVQHLHQLGQLRLLLHGKVAMPDEEVQGHRHAGDLEILAKRQGVLVKFYCYGY